MPVRAVMNAPPLVWGAGLTAAYFAATEERNLDVIDAEIAGRAHKRDLEELSDRFDPDSRAAPASSPTPRQDPRSASRAWDDDAAPAPAIHIRPGSRLHPRHRVRVR